MCWIKKLLPIPNTGSNFWSLVRSQLHYQSSQTLSNFMAVLAYTHAFYTLVWTNTITLILVKTHFIIPKDSAFISSKSCFNQCKHSWIISVPKIQRDWQMAFQFYIVDFHSKWNVTVRDCRFKQLVEWQNSVNNTIMFHYMS